MSDQELRDAGPAGLSTERHSSLRTALLAEIDRDRNAARTTARSDAKVSAMFDTQSRASGRLGGGTNDSSRQMGQRGQRKGARRSVGVAVAALCVVATATAAAATVVSILRPDPQESAKVIDKASEQVQWHNDGWRPELQAELANCISGPGSTVPEFEAYASDFPLTDAIDSDDYLRACDRKAAELGETATTPRLCVSGTGQVVDRAVLLDGSACGQAGLRNLTGSDLVALNAARSAEVSLLAFPQDCPTVDQATSWVRGKLGHLALPLTLAQPASGESTTTTTVTPSGTGSPCYRGFVDWGSSTVTIAEYSMPD